MIQFNLLPDIKMTYIKARRNKHLVILGAVIVSGVSLAILVLLILGVLVFQKKHLSDLSKDINNESQTLQKTPELNKVLTIQNQINSLSALHSKKPVVSRLFDDLTKLTPNTLSVQKIDVDFVQNTMNINGNADALSTINKFVDTLKFTNYTTDTQTVPAPAFNKVVLSSFGLSSDDTDAKKKATYSVTLFFDPAIFNNAALPILSVPKITSTRSETEKPNDLFSAPTTTNNATQAQ